MHNVPQLASIFALEFSSATVKEWELAIAWDPSTRQRHCPIQSFGWVPFGYPNFRHFEHVIGWRGDCADGDDEPFSGELLSQKVEQMAGQLVVVPMEGIVGTQNNGNGTENMVREQKQLKVEG